MKIAAIAISPVFGGKPKSLNEAAARAVKGVRQVVRIDEAVAVVADHMWRGQEGTHRRPPSNGTTARTRWSAAPTSSASSRKHRSSPARSHGNEGDAEKALAGAAQRIDAVYQVPFLAHAAMEPMNCTVHLRKDGCEHLGRHPGADR